MVHTGVGSPWADPALLEDVAAAKPSLSIVLAHAGHMAYAAEAGQVAGRHANVYLEPSWVGGFVIRRWVEGLGAERLMFGSDHADNAATELAKYRSMKLTDQQLEAILGGTAARVFGIEAKT
jgi:predicted TIM-barrel fold metal-dependent hydrolase